MLRNSNIVAVGRGNKRINSEMIKNRPTITVFVEKKLANSAIEKNQRIPKYIRGIETDVYERKIDSRLEKLSDVKLMPDLKPALGGGSIAIAVREGACASTLTYAFTNKGKKDKLYAVTSEHIFTRGENPMKPGGSVFYFRGNNEKDLSNAWKLGRFEESKTQQYLKNDIDAALIYVGENNSQGRYLIAPGLLNGKFIVSTHAVTHEDINEKVYKIGGCTGYTEGEILSIKTIIRTRYTNKNISITDTDQICTTVRGDDGDSGSLGIMKRTQEAVGMQNSSGGGQSWFSEIDKVLKAFNIEFLV